MTYHERICLEFDKLRDKHAFCEKLIRKSQSAKLAKLRRYIARSRHEHVANQKWLADVFSGRPNRTPWKVKGHPYIPKAKRNWVLTEFGVAYVNQTE